MALLLKWKDRAAYFLGVSVSVEEINGKWIAIIRKPFFRQVDARPETRQIDGVATEMAAMELAERAVFGEIGMQLGQIGLCLEPLADGHAAGVADTLGRIADEVSDARLRFPGNAHMLAALMEEVGELARALLESGNGPAAQGEALQVAAVALRLIEEGDGDFAGRRV